MPAEALKSRNLLIIGAGGHAAVVVEIARATGWNPVAALDPGSQRDVVGVPVRGSDEILEAVLAEGNIAAGIVAIGDNTLRMRLAARLRSLHCPTPTLIHPSATISPTATLGGGTVVMAHAVINARAKVGADCIINTSAIIEHDCVLEDGVHAAPRSVMGGTCHLGTGTLFGIGAVARPGTRIGSRAIIGAGAVVVSAISDGAIVTGVPASAIGRPR